MEKELPERDDWFDGLAEFATVAPVSEEADIEITPFRQAKDSGIVEADSEAPVQTEASDVEVSERDDWFDGLAEFAKDEDATATETPVPRERPVEAVAEDVAEAPVIAAGTVPEIPVAEKTGYESLNHPDTGITDDVETYWKLRAGKEGERRIKEGETRAEYLDRFLTDQFRPIVGGRLHTPFIEADWLSGAPEEARHAFGRVLSRIETEAPEIYEMQSDDAAQAAYDYIYYSATDPTSHRCGIRRCLYDWWRRRSCGYSCS
jgi:hypothetical protein